MAEEELGVVKSILNKCTSRKERATKIELTIRLDAQKSKFLATIQTAMEENFLNIQQLQGLILNTDVMDTNDEEIQKLKVELKGKIEYQTDKMTHSIMEVFSKTHGMN